MYTLGSSFKELSNLFDGYQKSHENKNSHWWISWAILNAVIYCQVVFHIYYKTPFGMEEGKFTTWLVFVDSIFAFAFILWTVLKPQEENIENALIKRISQEKRDAEKISKIPKEHIAKFLECHTSNLSFSEQKTKREMLLATILIGFLGLIFREIWLDIRLVFILNLTGILVLVILSNSSQKLFFAKQFDEVLKKY